MRCFGFSPTSCAHLSPPLTMGGYVDGVVTAGPCGCSFRGMTLFSLNNWMQATESKQTRGNCEKTSYHKTVYIELLWNHVTTSLLIKMVWSAELPLKLWPSRFERQSLCKKKGHAT